MNNSSIFHASVHSGTSKWCLDHFLRRQFNTSSGKCLVTCIRNGRNIGHQRTVEQYQQDHFLLTKASTGGYLTLIGGRQQQWSAAEVIFPCHPACYKKWAAGCTIKEALSQRRVGHMFGDHLRQLTWINLFCEKNL